MKDRKHFPLLYQVNTRAWLTAFSRVLGRPATLDDIPDTELDRIAASGMEWIWLLSVWQTGEAGREVSRSHAGWRKEFEEALPDLRDEDIQGSGFAVQEYRVSQALGGDAALARLRRRMRARGMKLMLDFVPNHMARDHAWVQQHPEFFVQGSEEECAKSPESYFRAGAVVVAHGRDPYFPPWPDTAQLDYSRPEVCEAMMGELRRVVAQCDGLRCDMAMLMLPEVFQRTWGRSGIAFWPGAIAGIRAGQPDFLFLAEVYWDLEWTLQQQGFDMCYDKRLYDRLRAGVHGPVRDHLRAGLDFQDRLARFLENHDELRSAAVFDAAQLRAAAVVTYLSPGLKLFHQGQFEGRRKRVSPHLVRWPEEPGDPKLLEFYAYLLAALREPAVRFGQWRMLEVESCPGSGLPSDGVFALMWEAADVPPVVALINYSDASAGARVGLARPGVASGRDQLMDVLPGELGGSHAIESDGAFVSVQIPPWGVRILRVQPAG